MFTFLGFDKPTLRRCSLVCRAFLHLARTHLYHYQQFHIDVDFIAGGWALLGPPKRRADAHLLFSNPHLANYVRKLYFSVDMIELVQDETATTVWMRYLGFDWNLDDSDDPYQAVDDAFADFLPDKILSYCKGGDGPVELVKLFPQVEIVEVDSIFVSTKLFHTLSSCPRLRSLTFDTADALKLSLSNLNLPTAFPSLQSLSITLYAGAQDRGKLEEWCAQRGIALNLHLLKTSVW